MNLQLFFLTLFLLYFFVQFFSFLVKLIGLPKVVGEIMGGIVFSFIYKEIELFNPSGYGSEGAALTLDVVYWLGIVFLMFISGFEISIPKAKESIFNTKNIVITITSLVIPFICGIAFCRYIFDASDLLGKNATPFQLQIIFGIVSAIVSIPVISRIFEEYNLLHTKFAANIISIATFHDVILWAIFSFILKQNLNTANSIFSILIDFVLFFAFWSITIFIFPVFFKKIKTHIVNSVIIEFDNSFFFFILFFFLLISHLLGINFSLCAFLAGLAISNLKGDRSLQIKKSIKEFSSSFLIPLYFGLVGSRIKIDIADLNFTFLQAFIFLLFIQGIIVFVLIYYYDRNIASSLDYSLSLNAKGGPLIVIADLALQEGVINNSFHFYLILLSMISSSIAGIWLRYRSAKLTSL